MVSLLVLLVGLGATKAPYQSPGEAIRAARTLVLVQAAPPDFKVVEVFAGKAPKRFSANLETFADPPKIAPGELLLLPLVQVDGRWAAAPSTRAPIRIAPASQRAAVRFIHQWRERDRWSDEALLGLVRHPAPLARQIGLDALSTGTPASTELVNRMVALLETPGVERDDRRALVRVIAARGGEAGVRALASAWRTLATDDVRLSAAGVLARSKLPEAQSALVNCAKTERGALATRCVRILARRAQR